MAECDPAAFRWPMQPKGKGATVIHVDSGFTRTSAWWQSGCGSPSSDVDGSPAVAARFDVRSIPILLALRGKDAGG
jgi:hypothetical protein